MNALKWLSSKLFTKLSVPVIIPFDIGSARLNHFLPYNLESFVYDVFVLLLYYWQDLYIEHVQSNIGSCFPKACAL